jgi:hypothetical protein
MSRPETTRAVARGAERALRLLGHAVIREMSFANGRRADLMALSRDGGLHGVEVKSGIEDFRADGKWHEYRAYCDYLFFAVGPDFPLERLPEDVGLIVADAYGGVVVRSAPHHPLAPARRKALTLAFARAASERLMLLTDPDFRPQ